MKLSPAAIYCLSEAINKLHEAARLVETPLAEDIRELADKIEVVKREGFLAESKIEPAWNSQDGDIACDFI